MEKCFISLTPNQLQQLQKVRDSTGLSQSEIVRRLIDQYLEKMKLNKGAKE